MVDVRIGIVSWNTAELLGRCLDALPAAFEGLDVEVVVVDNASSDGSADEAAARPWVETVRNNENLGYARAMNQALAGTDADVVVALNPDTEPPPRSITGLVAALAEHPRVGLVAPRLLNADGTVQHSVYRFPSLRVAAAVGLPEPLHRGPVGRRFWLEGHHDHARSGPVDWAIGAVHCIRVSALRGEPPYDERWFMYVEDLDLCWRLRQAGWATWLAADVSVPHVGNAAGDQAWGADRTARWLHPTYQWYEATNGPVAVRLWAAMNTLVVVIKLGFAAIALGLRLPGSERRRTRARALRSWLRFHGRKLISGADAPLLPSQEERPVPQRRAG
ncbi:MAG: hypothetical protein QOE35_318 [Actinomycetota bacterium]